MKSLVLTLAIGPEYTEIAQLTHPSIREYATRIAAEFICIEGPEDSPHWNKFQIFNLLKTYDRILYVDTDLIIRDDCPNLFDMVSQNQLGIFEEGSFSPRGGYIQSALSVYKETLDWDGKYYNTGVMVLSRCHRELFREPEPWVKTAGDFLEEQTFLNLRILKNRIPIFPLPYTFNRMTLMDALTGESRLNSYIVHYAGAPNHFELLDIIRQDLTQWREDRPEYKYRRNIVLQISGGMGDQIAAEPVARYLIEKMYPDADISIVTDWPRLFRHLNVPVSPPGEWQVSSCFRLLETMPGLESPIWKVVPHTLCHSTDFSSMAALRRMLPRIDKQIHLSSTLQGLADVMDLINVVNLKNMVLVHPGRGWPSKTFPAEWWERLVKALLAENISVGVIGKTISEDQGYVEFPLPDGATDFRDLLSLDGLISMIEAAPVLISNDSAPVHIAGAFDHWILLIPTCKHPDMVLPYRKGTQCYKAIALYKELTVDAVDSSPTHLERQTLDYVPGDIWDYLPEVEEVVTTAQRCLNETKTGGY